MGCETDHTYGRGDGDAAAMAALQRFREYAQAGDMHGVLQAASDACHAAPQLPQPHYANAGAWLALCDPARATSTAKLRPQPLAHRRDLGVSTNLEGRTRCPLRHEDRWNCGRPMR
jgi:hypothetical protein